MSSLDQTIGHVIYTHNRLNDARINMELSRLLWASHPEVVGVNVVHAYNGKEEFGYEQYIENSLLIRENIGHFRGAIDLINTGIDEISQSDAKYAVITASDTWITDSDWIVNLIKKMRDEGKVIACSAWGTDRGESLNKVGMSLDFFILDLEWNKESKLFPINYLKYLDKYQATNFALGGGVLVPERALSFYFIKYWSQYYTDNDLSKVCKDKILRILEREPIHDIKWKRKMNWPGLGIYTDHDTAMKRRVINELSKTKNLGPYCQKLIAGEIDLNVSY